VTVAIITDSAASLPPELAKSLDISVLPMWITLGGRSLHDDQLTLEEVAAQLDDHFTTSGPTPGEVAKAIQEADTGDGAVVLTLAQTMSSTHQAAELAARESGTPVTVIDTETAAGAEGLVVLAAARRAAAGGSMAEVVEAANRARQRVRLVATLPGLDHLARSGRVPGVAAWAGRWLGLSPMFEFRRGGVRPLRPARGQAAAEERILAMWRNGKLPQADLHVAGMHALDRAAAERLIAGVNAVTQPATSFVGSFGPVMVAHTGPGLVGLAWWWDEPVERSG
jgi:DegV family protein with EDD domain